MFTGRLPSARKNKKTSTVFNILHIIPDKHLIIIYHSQKRWIKNFSTKNHEWSQNLFNKRIYRSNNNNFTIPSTSNFFNQSYE